MSNFNYNVFLPKVIAISNSSINSIKDDFKAMFQCFDKLEEDLQNASARARDKSQKDKNAAKTLQSINEDDTESPKILDDKTKHSSESRTSTESSTERRGSKKRSKHEVEGMESPEQEKRQKRNASVKAQSIITKQVNVNLTQKLRRENSLEKGRRRRGKNDDKENAEPLPVIQVKQEKISIPPEPEPMDVSSPEASLAPDVAVKQESKDDLAMPPPAAPGPKSRKGIQKEKSEDSTDDEATGVRRTTSQRSRRTRKQTDTAPAQPVTNVHTLPGADCHSDHQLLIGKLRLKLQNSRSVKHTKRIDIYDKSSFTKSLEAKHKCWLAETENAKDSNSLWLSAKEYIKEVVTETQPREVKVKRQHWMSMNTWKLVEERRLMKAEGATITELNDISATIQAACRRDRNDALRKLCEELEQHSRKFESRDLHNKIRYLARQFKPKTWAIENSVGVKITEIKDIVTEWRNYCRSLFSDNNTLQDHICLTNIIEEREPAIMRDEDLGNRVLANGMVTFLIYTST
ncbi:jg15531 [Pararge aegeria aegeria]|uniref:Jg15531 protein n=1 Tax=Pararge aegeria aegeria TaxID=348720 RepID=A0A8S4SD00_9NEOP|nr:jg15531 [Pararge aegeria aegeria]